VQENRLANMILLHWRAHRPQMVAELERSNQLSQAVQEAQERAADLLYEFLSVRKMQFNQAWELAMRECLLPEDSPSSLTPSPSKSRPATSG
jgi:hypothetical protein